MGILERLGLKRQRGEPKNKYEGNDFSLLFGRTTSGKTVNERTALQTTAVYACVRILSETIASLPLHVYRYTEGGKTKDTEHALYTLLHDEPNPDMTSFVFRETLMSHLLIWGNAYSQILRDRSGQVIGLYPLLPDQMSVHRSEKGKLFYVYNRFEEDNPNFQEKGSIVLSQEEVLHIPGLGFDGLIGYSPIALAKNAVGMTLACE